MFLMIPESKYIKDEGKAYTIYSIEIRIKSQSWAINRRYSEFESLHLKLKTIFPAVSQLEFPGKMLRGLMKMTTQLTETRRKGLEKYLKVILVEYLF